MTTSFPSAPSVVEIEGAPLYPEQGPSLVHPLLSRVEDLFKRQRENLEIFQNLVLEHNQNKNGGKLQYGLVLAKVIQLKQKRSLEQEEKRKLIAEFAKEDPNLPECIQIARTLDVNADGDLDQFPEKNWALHSYLCCDWITQCLNMEICCCFELSGKLQSFETMLRRKVS